RRASAVIPGTSDVPSSMPPDPDPRWARYQEVTEYRWVRRREGDAMTDGTRKGGGSAAREGRLTLRDAALLLVLCGAIFLEGSDIAMLSVALPGIRADLGLATGELGGVVTAYVVGYGGFMLLGGRPAARSGRRRRSSAWPPASLP